MTAPGRIGFIPARFGPGIIGGAEIVLARLAHGFAERGWAAEVLTTCAIDHYSFANELPAGVSQEDGLTVRRFAAVQDTAGHEHGLVETAALSGARVPLIAQERWMNDGVRVPDLFHFLLDHGQDYTALVFGPYLFWPAFAGSQVMPERSVLWTCLHDEPYARFELFRPMLTGVAGLLLQTEPEHDLAHRLVPGLAPHAVTGCGVEVPAEYHPDRFRQRYGIDRPFLFYAGRREGAKGWEDLLRAFAGAVMERDLPFALVTAGSGPVQPPEEIADRVIDVGFLPEQDRDDAFAAAAAYLQPSRYEAFSRTIMEAWLAGTPVIANAASDVVRWHCERSGAGLVYDDELEFAEILSFLAAQPGDAKAMAASGRDYVLENYQWPGVLDRVEKAVTQWVSA
ncbi:MAG TPA: glycosyltransferase family 4 protein [Mycobacteriales bacterium]|nr:glycosyltransferase family 4 protein [Mycobacteriales bacterium]